MTDLTLTDADTQISEEQVVEYLRQHPGFFVNQPNLLADLTLPHQSGKAISLVERQVSVLRERNMDMRHRLSNLLDNARNNDRLFDKTKRLILNLLEAHDLADATSVLFDSFNHDFEIHYTNLILYGDSHKLKAGPAQVVRINEARNRIGSLIQGNRVLCGTFSTAEMTFLFGEEGEQVGSAAIVPLVHGNSFGILAIGNRDSNYYRSSMGTLFLGYIAEVLNRTLPRFLPS